MGKIITFAIAAYNSEKFIEKCLDSFVTEPQYMEKIEVLVVSDGSTDRTAQLTNEYISKYPMMIRLIEKENGGHGSAINVAAKEATGKFFKMIDADDWIDNSNLKEFVDRLENTDTDIVLSDYLTHDISNEKEELFTCRLEDANNYTLADNKENWNVLGDCLTFHGITYNTEFYKKNGTKLCEHVFYEDHQYATIPCCYAKSIAVFKHVVYVYRIGDSEQSVSYQNQYKRRGHVETVLSAMAEYFSSNKSSMDDAGVHYYIEKISRLLLSYMVIILFLSPSYSKGRAQVRSFKKELEKYVPELKGKIKKRYFVLMTFSYLHISRDMYQKIVQSEWKNKFTKK